MILAGWQYSISAAVVSPSNAHHKIYIINVYSLYTTMPVGTHEQRHTHTYANTYGHTHTHACSLSHS